MTVTVTLELRFKPDEVAAGRAHREQYGAAAVIEGARQNELVFARAQRVHAIDDHAVFIRPQCAFTQPKYIARTVVDGEGMHPHLR